MERKIRIFHPVFDIGFYLVVCTSLVTAIITSLVYPNVILEQGLSHRIFYLHVPVAWVALYGPILSFICSLIFLFTRNLLWDRLAFTANQLSFLFAVGVLFSGPIWAYSAWGVPWDKTDARLQSFFILCISLVSYFIFRYLVPSKSKKAILSAYLSVLCAVSAILTWGAIRWIENPGNHPSSVLGKGGMDSDMKLSMWLGVFAFHFLFLILFLVSNRTEKIQDIRSKLKAELD
ncbi:cytochrome c biogenesis protein [Leptospira sp. 2 VSF19]|uniref:Heme exporter protein C n=1 Tax=Leptospira soteropolitanensis TaxID=2950025 RepID=A0AAW5VGB1_9LEPT|nr:cytochrome c biogenesis protein CcsA [Leptospira soteropolitanensis]MCW7493265.1 cytochrome c biogenesis protein [Leptospira soteropolitanensis]MCW7500666.1 cytochrome c biogenesis protein [Leptospira soteropolitanensis]MCW7523115.1 cytochrome c biogenesis protein [Leptospira soteropolitanensis]MCW7526778.1 cytochrome c biogenesis protein [Leptospira soteropolitanensis]MCW7530833.1 cytochrome c biogenesis protein [Leptospira soteropolitanensis]